MSRQRFQIAGTVYAFTLVAGSAAAAQQASVRTPVRENVLVVQAVDVTPGRAAPAHSAPPSPAVARTPRVGTGIAPPAPTATSRIAAISKWKVEEIDGEVRRSQGEWLLEIEYEVREESKTALSNDVATLFIELREAGRAVVREDDTPVVLEVTLDRPTDSEKRKREFEGKVHVSLGEEYHGDLESLELAARVELNATHEIVAQDSDEVDYDDGRGIRGFSLTLFGFGGGLCW